MQFNGKNFCDLNYPCYVISEEKEIFKRRLKNLTGKVNFCSEKKKELLPNVVSTYSNVLIKVGKDIDPVLQENKAVNIKIACSYIDGMIIHPNEVFSFWRTLGKITKGKGYLDGRVIVCGKMKPRRGGGLCNLGNTIHNLILFSPLEVTEFHSHSDALACDIGHRVPFSSGTSVSYNYIDYRFRNNTNQDVQLHMWCADGKLYGELRSMTEFPQRFELEEKDHHFHKEGEKYYRISKIYKKTIDKATDNVVDEKLVFDNHSEVMFDPSEIPQEMIR